MTPSATSGRPLSKFEKAAENAASRGFGSNFSGAAFCLSWFGHVCRHETLQKTMLQGTVEGARHKGRSRKSWKATSKNGQVSHCVGAAHRIRHGSMGNHHSRMSAEVLPTTPGRHGN